MKDLIDRFTVRAIEHHDDGATAEYYRLLRERKRFHTTRCTACGRLAYPPRPFCPDCYGEAVEWVDVSDREATLYAFTTQQRGLRFLAPDVLGVVEIEGLGRIVTKIEAPLEALRIGQRLRFEPLEIASDLWVHSYRPVSG